MQCLDNMVIRKKFLWLYLQNAELLISLKKSPKKKVDIAEEEEKSKRP